MKPNMTNSEPRNHIPADTGIAIGGSTLPAVNGRISSPVTTKAVEEVLRLTDIATAPLIAELERRSPGHRFGRQKDEHMKEMVQETEAVAAINRFNQSETLLLKCVLRLHDVGRHLEALRDLDTLRDGLRHGNLSRGFVIKQQLLAPLPKEFHQPLLDAIFYHAEREVNLEPGSFAYKLCYALRDLDKKEGLTSSLYLEPQGILDEMSMHFFRHWLNLSDNFNPTDELKSQLLTTIQDYLGNPRPPTHPVELPLSNSSDINPNIVESSVHRILSGGIPEHMIEAFQRREALDFQDVIHSWSSYMLWLLSWSFDVKSPSMLAEIKTDPNFKAKLDFIKQHVSESDFEKIDAVLKI